MKSQVGQGLLMAVLLIGALMATFVFFGAKRGEDTAILVQKLDSSQSAYEALASAAKRIQYMYAVDSGCDPGVLDSRLSAMANLPDLSAVGGSDDLGVQVGGKATYVVAVPGGSSVAVRHNRCTSATGCRQLAVPIDNMFFIVTAGQLIKDTAPGGRTIDCPRDASIRLSTVVGGNAFFQKFSFTNICSLASCTCVDSSTCAAYDKGFLAQSITNNNSSRVTTACGYLNARRYGSMVNTTSSLVTHDDLRWARRYLETGAGALGETNFLYVNAALPAGVNGACTVAGSGGQCKANDCVPAFDLNRDGSNNDADLAILENYLRGYVLSIPVNELQ